MKSSYHIAKALIDKRPCPSHPFTGWTSLVTLSEYVAVIYISFLISDFQSYLKSIKFRPPGQRWCHGLFPSTPMRWLSNTDTPVHCLITCSYLSSVFIGRRAHVMCSLDSVVTQFRKFVKAVRSRQSTNLPWHHRGHCKLPSFLVKKEGYCSKAGWELWCHDAHSPPDH